MCIRDFGTDFYSQPTVCGCSVQVCVVSGEKQTRPALSETGEEGEGEWHASETNKLCFMARLLRDTRLLGGCFNQSRRPHALPKRFHK